MHPETACIRRYPTLPALAASLISAISLAGVILLTGCTPQPETNLANAQAPAPVAAASVPSADEAAEPAVAAQETPGEVRPATTVRKPVRPANPLDALRAFRYLEQICAFGPRYSGSPGMEKQQELLHGHFEQLGGVVTLQRLQAKNPLGGAPVPMVNMLVEWHPERQDRILLCAHYDTRPLPDRDPDPVQRRQGIFLGANDGASGVAVLMELAHLMPQFDSKYGIDFALFDGEELVYVDGRDPYFVGSTWFAQQHVRQPPAHKYRWGVLFDMVGDADLQIHQEHFSASWRDTRPLVKQIWATAAGLGVEEFVPRVRYKIQDDHLPLRNIGKIPTCLIIDFEYPAWHTAADTPRRCSPTSLAKVGWVVYEWLGMVE